MKRQTQQIITIVQKYQKPSARTFTMIAELATTSSVESVIKKYLKPVPQTFWLIAELQALPTSL